MRLNNLVLSVWLLAGCAGSGLAAAAGWPRFESVPGGVAVVNIPSEEKPVGYFNNMRVMTIGSRGQWQAIIGLPLTTQPGSHTLRVRVGPDQHEYDFNVAAKHYPESRITLADERMINPLPMDLERIDRETRLIQAAKATWSEVAAPPLAMSQPVAGEYSSPYGLRRFFNNQARNPHSGLDIAAPEGTPVMSAAPGRVVSTGDYFFNGNTVFIDHGQGLLTMYCHLQRIAVTPGQKIEAGMIIGNVGRTGRVTAAHLHWSVILNQTMVDPQLFLAGGTERP